MLKMKIPCIVYAVVLFLISNCANERPIEMPQSKCSDCHSNLVDNWLSHSSSHSLLFTCEFCHEQKKNTGSAGHMANSECNECHTEVMHFPLISLTRSQCTVCHNPHGSSNLYLIKESIEFDKNPESPVIFHSLAGKGDYSFAELGEDEGGKNGMARGTGLCEVCHSTTIYYNSSGNGAEHFTERCIDCHKHTLGFYAGEK
jgi:predicted CXXCH cytochrome family protein